MRARDNDLAVAFVGTYPPRRCGIATFTKSLATAITSAEPRTTTSIIAITDAGEYDYPNEVRYRIRQGALGDYARAAEFINYSGAAIVSLQHEHGIFGGDDGAYVLDLLAALRVPTIATLHTVLKAPSRQQRALVQRIAGHCATVVVMSEFAADLLRRSYEITTADVRVVPHGIPALQRHDRARLKAGFGVANAPMLLTFGLLGPSKGIEIVLRALPRLVAMVPKLRYFVVGATHPHVLRREGEAYRTSLERLAEELGIRSHVVFRDQFVTDEELGAYMQAADIFVSPYHGEAQVTSGALSYAMGAGTAVVSTPYWHAKELLADGRGRLFPFGDSVALGDVLTELLTVPAELERLRAASHEHTRPLVWPRIGETYVGLIDEAIARMPVVTPTEVPIRASSLPEFRIDHLVRLTDDTGIIQHATFTIPERRSGYCVDDNARALLVALRADAAFPSEVTRSLIATYLAYLYAAQERDGTFRNLMNYDRTFPTRDDSHDSFGRAMWALGSTVAGAADEGARRLAIDMLRRALPGVHGLGPRGAATTILGLVRLLDAQPDAADVRAAVTSLADMLVRRFHGEASEGWRWFEPTLTYDNALISLALFDAHGVLGDPAILEVARDSLWFLERICFEGNQMRLVGNSRWHARGRQKPEADEQAIDAAAFVLAFRGAWLATGDGHYLVRMRQAFAWFLGNNRLGLPLFDPSTGGCRDGLGASDVNQNQGAESTICFLLALLEMLDLAHDGLEHASEPQRAR